MKIGIISLHTVLSDNLNRISSAEICYIAKLAEQNNIDINIIGKWKKTNIFPKTNVKILNLDDVYSNIEDYGFTHIFVWTCKMNFFGGAENMTYINGFRLLSNFTGKILYWSLDNRFLMEDIWPKIHNKKWIGKYTKDEFEFDKDNLICISQFRDLKKTKKEFDNTKGALKFKEYYHFPIARFPLFVSKRIRKNLLFKNIELGYGGYIRPGRKTKFNKFYLEDNSMTTEIFGKIDKTTYTKTEISSNITFNNQLIKVPNMIPYMSKFLSTIIIGDKFYENNNVPARIYEAIQAGIICFIDYEYDPNYMIFPKEFGLHVNSNKEAKTRLDEIINNDDYMNMIDKQLEHVLKFDDVAEFKKLMEKIV